MPVIEFAHYKYKVLKLNTILSIELFFSLLDPCINQLGKRIKSPTCGVKK